MSLKAMSWATKQDCLPLSKLVLMLLADHCDGEGQCWPSVRHLAQRSGMSERSVQTHLRKLEDLELIERTTRKEPGRRTQTNLYRLLEEGRPGNSMGAGDAPIPPQDVHPPPRRSCTPEGAPAAPMGAGAAPSLNIESPKEPSIGTLDVRTSEADVRTPMSKTDVREAVKGAYVEARHAWSKATHGKRTRLPNLDTPAVHRAIDAAVKHYDLETARDAVRGIFLAPHNLGKNDTGQTYLDIQIALRMSSKGDNVHRFAELWRKQTAGATSKHTDREARRKRLAELRGQSPDSETGGSEGLNERKADPKSLPAPAGADLPAVAHA